MIQLHHALEDHDHGHVVCTSKTEKHFHEGDESDCSMMHYQMEINATDFNIAYEILPKYFVLTNFNELPTDKKNVTLIRKSSRAPPITA